MSVGKFSFDFIQHDSTLSSLSPVEPLSLCPAFEGQGENVTKQVTMRYITELKNILADDIKALGWSFKLIDERIFGSMQLSPELMTYGPGYIQKFNNIKGDEIERNNFASDLRTKFSESFEEAETAREVMEAFCDKMVKSFDGTQSLHDQLYKRCMDESWRFQAFINDASTTHFEFSIVPMRGQTCSN